MADFDYGSLSPEQNKIALKVVDAAKKYGLNPDLIVPLIMAESQMSHIPSDRLDKNGKPVSNGVMQLTPGTAAQYGVKDYMSGDVDANINAGMNFLSDLSKNSAIGNNPRKLIAGYNAGAGSTYVKTGNETDLLPETKKHIENISKYSLGNNLVSAESYSNSQQDPDSFFKEPVAQETSPENRAAHDDFFGTEKPKEIIAEKPEEPKGSQAGVQGGAIVGGSLSVAANTAAAVNDYFSKKKDIAPSIAPVSISSVEPPLGAEADITSGEKWNKGQGWGKGKGTVADVVQAGRRAKSNGKISKKLDELYGVRQEGEPASIADRLIEKSKLAEAKATVDENNRKQKIIDDAATAKTANEVAAATAKTANEVAANNAYSKSVLGRTLGFAVNTLRGGLSGMGALYGYETARDALKNNQYAQSGLHALSGLASGADLVASIPAIARTGIRTVAAPLAIASDTGANLVKHYQSGEYGKMPADVAVGALAAIPYAGVPLSLGASYLRDHPEIINSLAKGADAQRMLTNVDLMGNPY